jgi:hypothetical protein
MSNLSYELHELRIFEFDSEGTPLRSGRDATDLMSIAWEHRAGLIVVPVKRLDEDFFRLRTGVAGEIVQKFATYGMRVAIVGDISRYVDESSALGDFVRESNRGTRLWFLANAGELDQRLQTFTS